MPERTFTISTQGSGDTLAGMIATLDELAAPPYKVTTQLEVVLQAAFRETQEKTHVITGSLKASGKTQSDFDGNRWTGEISYGGGLWKVPTPGPAKEPVDYAIYEMARGGDHDFFAGLVGYEPVIENIINEHFPDR